MYVVYLIKLYNNNESFYKIGFTSRFSSRFYFFRKSGYNVEIIWSSNQLNLRDASELEYRMQKKNCKNKYLPQKKFSGYTECYKKVDI